MSAARACSRGAPREHAILPAVFVDFGYNGRNELTSAVRGATNWTYGYDPIGNRTTSAEAGQPTVTYTANELNQYTQPQTSAPIIQRTWHDDDGNLVEYSVAGDSDCDGDVDFTDTNYFIQALQGEPVWAQYYRDHHGGQNPPCPYLNNDVNGDGLVNFNDLNPFVGQMGAHGTWQKLEWDAENRLIAVTPQSPTVGVLRAEYRYDYRGRRIEKRLFAWNGSAWNPSPYAIRRYVWDGWRLVLELDGLNQDAVVRKYTWGLDLAGQHGDQSRDRKGAVLEGAGTIGGLAAVLDTAGDRTFVYFYDGNGNVGQLVETTTGNFGTLAVKYEYGPYGTRFNAPTPGEYEQPFRFSTKQFDAETGMYYYGYRYYRPEVGRWSAQDPVDEPGATLLRRARADVRPRALGTETRSSYGYTRNQPVSRVDPLGLDWVPINAKWDAWLTGNAATRLAGALVEENPVYWLLRFLARHGEASLDSFEFSNDVAVAAFMGSMLFDDILRKVEIDAHYQARQLNCGATSRCFSYLRFARYSAVRVWWISGPSSSSSRLTSSRSTSRCSGVSSIVMAVSRCAAGASRASPWARYGSLHTDYTCALYARRDPSRLPPLGWLTGASSAAASSRAEFCSGATCTWRTAGMSGGSASNRAG
ncbi:MAG: RHS repeat-associated core domain-containing protein [Planctomycetota bacterium]